MWTLNGGDQEDGDGEPSQGSPSSPPSGTEPDPLTWVGVLLFFGQARTLYLVGKALAETYPTAQQFEVARNDPDLQSAAQALAEFLTAVRTRALANGLWDVRALEKAGVENYEDGLRAVGALSQKLGLEPDTLLTALASL